MEIGDINNYFGDMDLFLMDFVLKGKLPDNARVLDIGCGEGRNAVYFIREGIDFVGIDNDASKISMVQYLCDQITSSKAYFEAVELASFKRSRCFNFIICSRVLHFCNSERSFFESLDHILSLLETGGILYLSMDSIIDSSMGQIRKDGTVAFPDGKIRFALNEFLYQKILKNFQEVEPLRTLIHRNARAQSFAFLQKI